MASGNVTSDPQSTLFPFSRCSGSPLGYLLLLLLPVLLLVPPLYPVTVSDRSSFLVVAPKTLGPCCLSPLSTLFCHPLSGLAHPQTHFLVRAFAHALLSTWNTPSRHPCGRLSHSLRSLSRNPLGEKPSLLTYGKQQPVLHRSVPFPWSCSVCFTPVVPVRHRHIHVYYICVCVWVHCCLSSFLNITSTWVGTGLFNGLFIRRAKNSA